MMKQRIDHKWLLGFILALYAILGVTFSVIFPLGEAPDEPGHFTYVRYLTLEGKLPVLKPRYEDNETGAAHHPPAYYAFAVAPAGLFVDGNLRLYFNPLFDWTLWTPHFVTGPEHSFPWRGDYLAWHIARFASLSLGLATLLLLYLIAKQIFKAPLVATACVAYAALNPQFIYLHSYVTNDAMAVLVGVLLTYSTLLLLHKASLRSVALSGLVIALAILTKLTVLGLVSGVLLAFALRWKSLPERDKAKALFALLIPPGITGGWWFTRNLILYGDPLAFSRVRVVFARNYYPDPLSLGELLRVLPDMFRQTFKSFWGFFGWLNVPLPDELYLLIFLAHVAALLGLLWSFKEGIAKAEVWVLGVVGLGMVATFLQFNRVTNSCGWHGRFIMPTIGVIAPAFIAGWQRWLRRKQKLLAGFTIGAGAALSLYALWGVIVPLYLPPKFLPAGANIPNEMDVAFEGGLHLVGYELSSTKLKPGQTANLTLYWRLESPTPWPYRASVTAYTTGGECVIPSVESFLMRRYPTVFWPSGRVVKERYRLPTLTEAEQVVAPLSVFVFRGADKLPVPRLDNDGSPGENRVEIARIAVGLGKPLEISPLVELKASLGDGLIRMQGYDIEGELKAGGTFTVTLYWQAGRQIIERDYQAFVHVLGEEGQLIAQHDGPPRSGMYPTSVWSPGEIVADAHPITIPPDYRGKVRLLAGLYSLDTLERLRATNPEGVEYPDRAVPLGEFEVR